MNRVSYKVQVDLKDWIYNVRTMLGSTPFQRQLAHELIDQVPKTLFLNALQTPPLQTPRHPLWSTVVEGSYEHIAFNTLCGLLRNRCYSELAMVPADLLVLPSHYEGYLLVCTTQPRDHAFIYNTDSLQFQG